MLVVSGSRPTLEDNRNKFFTPNPLAKRLGLLLENARILKGIIQNRFFDSGKHQPDV
jgi:hypothetical protein